MGRSRTLFAFLAIYLVWGSTYYAIGVAVESIPPLGMMGARCLAAGLILYVWRRRSAPAPDAAAWRAALVAGGFLFLLSHGSLAWAEQRLAAGEAALRGAQDALGELRSLARGIHQPELDNGLADALDTLDAD